MAYPKNQSRLEMSINNSIGRRVFFPLLWIGQIKAPNLHCPSVNFWGRRGRSQWQAKRRRVPNVGWIYEYRDPETVTQIVHSDGQDIYDTAPAFGVIVMVMVMVMAPVHGTPRKIRQTNGKLMADTLGETFACLTWHTMATPIAKSDQNPNPKPERSRTEPSHWKSGSDFEKENRKTGQVNKGAQKTAVDARALHIFKFESFSLSGE